MSVCSLPGNEFCSIDHVRYSPLYFRVEACKNLSVLLSVSMVEINLRFLNGVWAI